MKVIYYGLLLASTGMLVNAQAADPSFTCQVSKTIPTGEKPIFATVVQPFTIESAQVGGHPPVNSELGLYCQANIANRDGAGSVECSFLAGQWPLAPALASASAAALPSETGFKGWLRLTLIYSRATDPANQGTYTLICNQN